MKIIVFSLGVMFEDVVQGGSQKVLRDLAIGLSERGHKITILCPYRQDNSRIYYIAPGAMVKPILPLREAFPLPYAVPPFDLVKVCELIGREIEDADLLYCHDGGLNIDFLKNQIPTVISLRDFCYTETLLGALNFNEESIIVNSMHTYLCLQDSFQHVNPKIKDKIRLVYNGYDGSTFEKKFISESFYKLTGLEQKSDEIIVGFPHRPDIDKGFLEALKVISAMKPIYGNRIKLLIPHYMDEGLSERTDSTYKEIIKYINEMQLSENIITYNWISHERMPELYSYCDVILCIGCFVEAFSNVSVESIMCGTPVIAANTSTYKTIPIKEYLNIVPYGNIDRIVKEIIKVLTENEVKLDEARSFILENLTISKMIDGFENVFLDALNSFQHRNEHTQTGSDSFCCMKKVYSENQFVRLTSWCQSVEGNIYNDYTHMYSKDIFDGVFEGDNVSVQIKDLINRGIEKKVIFDSINNGILIAL